MASSPSARAAATAAFARGVAHLAPQRWDEAAAAFREALAHDETLAEAHVNLGWLAQRQGRLDEAAAAYTAALALRPSLVEAWFNLANIFHDAGRWDSAVDAYRSALQLAPTHPGAQLNLASLRLKQNQPAAAEALVREVLAREPANLAALVNLGDILLFQHRIAEAIAVTREALRLAPELPQAHVNLGYAHLLAGDLAAGWPEYEYRWSLGPLTPGRIAMRPQWLGDAPVENRTILLSADAGMGDALQFMRYAPLLAARGARVHAELPPALHPLYAGAPFLAGLHARGAAVPECEIACTLTSLPLAFRTTLADIPPPLPVAASPAAIARWRRVLGPRSRPRIGLVWSGNPTHRLDFHRSTAFATLRTLVADFPTLDFFSLQNAVRDSDRAALADTPAVRDLSAHGIGAFDDSAALVGEMDLVIAVDTALAHLAGTLGRPTWLLLSYLPDWRWLLERDDTPWYPTLRLFRQPTPGDWSGVLARVRAALADLTATVP